MDGFIKRKREEPITIVKKQKTNFLAEVTALRAENEKDVGLDKLGDMRNNLCNVVQYFDLVKELDNVKTEIQQLQFSKVFPAEDYKLIEVDTKLADQFENGQRLVFRGDVDDFVVLCSEDRSYSVKEVETSNSLFICPELKVAQDLRSDGPNTLELRTISGLCNHYLELKPIECVSSHRLREKLIEKMLHYDWPEDENEKDSSNTYAYTDLLDSVQMSEGEMKSILEKLPVVEHKGKLRYLSHGLRDKLIMRLVEVCDDDDEFPNVNVDQMSFEELRSAFSQSITDEIIQWFLIQYCTPILDGYVLKEGAVVRELSSYLLRQVTKVDLGAFEKQINQLLPTGMSFDIVHLAGIALLEDSFKGKHISYLNVEDLPENPRERLKLLFEKKSSWHMEEVAPYLSDICSSNKAMNALMVSHCRTMKSADGLKVFCSLKPV
ncbi:unnamed protein product [Auanema sp. JU1783]|nr:unnamed protein product [Auanema sp. JU1783]